MFNFLGTDPSKENRAYLDKLYLQTKALKDAINKTHDGVITSKIPIETHDLEQFGLTKAYNKAKAFEQVRRQTRAKLIAEFTHLTLLDVTNNGLVAEYYKALAKVEEKLTSQQITKLSGEVAHLDPNQALKTVEANLQALIPLLQKAKEEVKEEKFKYESRLDYSHNIKELESDVYRLDSDIYESLPEFETLKTNKQKEQITSFEDELSKLKAKWVILEREIRKEHIQHYIQVQTFIEKEEVVKELEREKASYIVVLQNIKNKIAKLEDEKSRKIQEAIQKQEEAVKRQRVKEELLLSITYHAYLEGILCDFAKAQNISQLLSGKSHQIPYNGHSATFTALYEKTPRHIKKMIFEAIANRASEDEIIVILQPKEYQKETDPTTKIDMIINYLSGVIFDEL